MAQGGNKEPPDSLRRERTHPDALPWEGGDTGAARRRSSTQDSWRTNETDSHQQICASDCDSQEHICST